MFDRWLDRNPKILSLLLGVLAATGFPPLQLWPVALLAMGFAAFLFLRAPGWKAAAWRGWLFGFGHFTATNAWIATSFTHQSDMPQFLGWFAVPLIGLYLAIYPALAAGLSAGLARTKRGEAAGPASFIVAFSGFWIITEWLRGWLFTGYAWGPFSLVLLGSDNAPGLAFLLPWLGTYALSGVAVLIGGMLVWLLAQRSFVVAAVLAATYLAGMIAPLGSREEGTMPYLVVQPDLDQQELNDPREYEPAFITLSGLSERRAGDSSRADGKRIVFWPESGLPDYLREGYPERYYRATTAGGDPAYAKRRLGAMLGADSLLLTGAVDLEIENDRAAGAYNVVTVLGEQGRILGSYRKSHLVPYGEYLPMRPLLEPLGLSRLVAGTIDFWQGPGPRTVDLGGYGRAGPQICYEIVFSGQIIEAGDRPDFVFNPSNDGWFGAWGPPQHFAQARMRAIEEGLPVIRSTTTGISGVIDADGIVRQSLGMGVEGRLSGFIPPAKAPTPFARWGNALGLIWAALLLGAALVLPRLASRSLVAMRKPAR